LILSEEVIMQSRLTQKQR
jgi:hypothetical protein